MVAPVSWRTGRRVGRGVRLDHQRADPGRTRSSGRWQLAAHPAAVSATAGQVQQGPHVDLVVGLLGFRPQFEVGVHRLSERTRSGRPAAASRAVTAPPHSPIRWTGPFEGLDERDQVAV